MDKVIIGKTKTKEQVKSYYVDYPNFLADIENQGVNIINPTEFNWFLECFLQAFLLLSYIDWSSLVFYF